VFQSGLCCCPPGSELDRFFHGPRCGLSIALMDDAQNLVDGLRHAFARAMHASAGDAHQLAKQERIGNSVAGIEDQVRTHGRPFISAQSGDV
jgi:hypothetical protein